MSGQESNGIGWKQAFKKTLEWCCGGLLERPYDLASCSSQNERSELRGDSLRERECGLRTLRVYVSQEVIPGAANKLRATESILDLDIGLVHLPTHPHRPFAAVKRVRHRGRSYRKWP